MKVITIKVMSTNQYHQLIRIDDRATILNLMKKLNGRMQVYILDMKGGVDYPRSWKGTLCSYNDSR